MLKSKRSVKGRCWIGKSQVVELLLWLFPKEGNVYHDRRYKTKIVAPKGQSYGFVILYYHENPLEKACPAAGKWQIAEGLAMMQAMIEVRWEAP